MWEKTDSDIRKAVVYIPLANEGTPVLRPAEGVRLEDGIFRILAPETYDPDDEEWEFPPETVVRCEREFRNGERILIAKERADFNSGAMPAMTSSLPLRFIPHTVS